MPSKWLLAAGGLFSAPAAIHAAQPAGTIAARAADLIPFLNGATEPASLMAPSLLAQVPPQQLKAIAADLRSRYGKALKLAGIEATGSATANVSIAYEHAVLRLRLVVEPGGKIAGLVVSGVDTPGDSSAAVIAQIRSLPGRTSVSLSALDGGDGPRSLAALAPGQVMAIGSAFKLFVLAELSRQVKAGERHWTDVVPLDHQSLPSGILQDWPQGSPLTLHTLAGLMISRSDNSAADTLLHLVGREKIEQLLPELGVGAAARDRPLLSTREMFAIKADPALTARWNAGDESARRAMLPPLDATLIDPSALAGAPKAIDSVEWFATADDLVRTMDWLRRNADETCLKLLAINPGIGPAAEGFDYLGYKGGSETGVIEMTFLIRRKDGSWRAVAAAWNNPAAALDEQRFVALVARLVTTQR